MSARRVILEPMTTAAVPPYSAGGPLLPTITRDPFALAAACGHPWPYTCAGCHRCTACAGSCVCGQAEHDYPEAEAEGDR